MNDVVVLASSPEVTARATAAEQQLIRAKVDMESAFYTLCELLDEIKANEYFHTYGFTSFEKWLDASDLDLSRREAYYYTSIARKARRLGVSREDIEPVKVSKLKKIFQLDPKEHSKEMRQLLAGAATNSLQAISDRVHEIRHKACRRGKKAH